MARNGASLADVLGNRTLAMIKRYSHTSPSHSYWVLATMNDAILGTAPTGATRG
jgi:hypothetical protein